jgi:hypothetical protein
MVSSHEPIAPTDATSAAGMAAEDSTSTSGGLLTVALTMRLVLFAVFQAVVAVVLFIAGVPEPWSASAAWWPLTATATSAVTFAFLRWRARVEGFSLTAFYRPVRPGAAKDVLLALAVAFVGGGLAVAASILLAPVFFTDPTTASALLIQPLPTWAALLAVALFPVSVALTELPLYFGYVQPRLGARTGSATAAVLVPAVFLSPARHAAAHLRSGFHRMARVDVPRVRVGAGVVAVETAPPDAIPDRGAFPPRPAGCDLHPADLRMTVPKARHGGASAVGARGPPPPDECLPGSAIRRGVVYPA